LIIQSGAWLNDKVMDACNTLVARHTGNDNNQSTLLVQEPGGGFQPARGDVIQILHDSDHWVACASIQGVVYLADSAQRPISGVLAKQLKQLFKTGLKKNGQLPVSVVPAATQPNGNDCGLYAAAFAFQWATGSMACDVVFDNSAMRLAAVPPAGASPFPATVVRKRGRKSRKKATLVVMI